MVEKSIGDALASALEINRIIGALVDESQISASTITNYLGNETVENLLVIRFANSSLSQFGTTSLSSLCRSQSAKM
jgi:glucose-6-phosphate 1-dehydrogenase